MKIDKDKQIHLLENLSKPSSTKDRKNTAQATAQSPGDTRDKVELSGWKEEVNRLKEKVKVIPVVRADKIANIQEALKTETYNVKGELVARSILKSQLLDEIF